MARYVSCRTKPSFARNRCCSNAQTVFAGAAVRGYLRSFTFRRGRRSSASVIRFSALYLSSSPFNVRIIRRIELRDAYFSPSRYSMAKKRSNAGEYSAIFSGYFQPSFEPEQFFGYLIRYTISASLTSRRRRNPK